MEYCTIDIGASSGKMLCGTLLDGILHTSVVHRFPNTLVRHDGHIVWDIDALYGQVLSGLRKAHQEGIRPLSIGIDTWGVDFVLLDNDGKMIGDAVSYRDKRTDSVVCPVRREVLYRRTGIQHLPFNTIYQLLALKEEHPDQLDEAQSLLMIPDYLSYLLCGQMHQEYTNATTTGLVDAYTGQWDYDLIASLGLPTRLFKPLSHPMDRYGALTERVAGQVGFQTEVVASPSHDTASAVFGSPIAEDGAFISSGTWSLFGCVMDHPLITEETRKANFTNEGGVGGTIRFLKNLMGLWMVQSVKKEWPASLDYNAIAQEANKNILFPSRIDVEDNRFITPASMVQEVRAACKESGQPVPETIGEIASCIYHSLAQGYADALEALERITGRKFAQIAIVGGGSKDALLCQLAADATGRTVTAGPDEGTAYGSLLTQMMAGGEIKDTGEAKAVLSRSVSLERYRRTT